MLHRAPGAHWSVTKHGAARIVVAVFVFFSLCALCVVFHRFDWSLSLFAINWNCRTFHDSSRKVSTAISVVQGRQLAAKELKSKATSRLQQDWPSTLQPPSSSSAEIHHHSEGKCNSILVLRLIQLVAVSPIRQLARRFSLVLFALFLRNISRQTQWLVNFVTCYEPDVAAWPRVAYKLRQS